MSRNTKYAERKDIMIDELLIKDPKFKKGFDAGFSRKQVVNDDWDEDLHPRDEDGKFTSSGGGGGSGSGAKGGKEKEYEPAMGEIPKEKFNKVSEHIANAEENAKMYANRMAKEPSELTRHNMENSLIEAKEYGNVLADLGYKAGENKDHYEPAEWDRDHAYEKLKQLADLAKEFDTIGHKISAGSNMEIYNKARESIRAHMSARLRAIQDLGLNNDYKDWKEACGYGDITGWDDVDWNDLS